MLNHVVEHGRLTRDPELRRTQSGVAVTSFGIAVEQDFTNKDGKRGVDFFDCTAWRQTAEHISKYFVKGQEILVTGRLQNESWNDKDGNKRTKIVIVVDRADFCGSKGDRSEAPSEPRDDKPGMADFNSYEMLDGEDGELPF